MPQADFLEVFQNATLDDLAAVQRTIEELENSLAGLRVIGRALETKLHGAVKRKSSTRKPKEEGGLEAKQRKVALFIKSNGNKSKQKISEALGINLQGPACLSQVLNSDLFFVNPDGIVSLTEKGSRVSTVQLQP